MTRKTIGIRSHGQEGNRSCGNLKVRTDNQVSHQPVAVRGSDCSRSGIGESLSEEKSPEDHP